jgi:hypothetical protein
VIGDVSHLQGRTEHHSPLLGRQRHSAYLIVCNIVRAVLLAFETCKKRNRMIGNKKE